MVSHERRVNIPLDEAYLYCRSLEAGAQKPELFKLCSAFRAVDSAISSSIKGSQNAVLNVSIEAWSKVRADLFKQLLRHFAGHFIIYGDQGTVPLEPGGPWPGDGFVSFYPEKGRRRDDGYIMALAEVDETTALSLRWLFADGRQDCRPSDFQDEGPLMAEVDQDTLVMLENLYEICAEESSRGKRRAHQKWWQLYWEADSCRDRRLKSALHKEMTALQNVWGRPG